LQDESFLHLSCIAVSPMQAGYAGDDQNINWVSGVLTGSALAK
jgi:hypothetical protein